MKLPVCASPKCRLLCSIKELPQYTCIKSLNELQLYLVLGKSHWKHISKVGQTPVVVGKVQYMCVEVLPVHSAYQQLQALARSVILYKVVVTPNGTMISTTGSSLHVYKGQR